MTAPTAAPNWKINIAKKTRRVQLDTNLKVELVKLIACSTSKAITAAQNNCCVEKIGPDNLSVEQQATYKNTIATLLREM